MKKILSTLFLLSVVVAPTFAEEFRSVCANHILVPTEAQAEKLKSQINSFNDFKYYARIYSQCPSGQRGGDLGCFRRGQMVKPFEQAAFEGKVDEVVGPVQTQFGCHLLWVTNKY